LIYRGDRTRNKLPPPASLATVKYGFPQKTAAARGGGRRLFLSEYRLFKRDATVFASKQE
jgi:hypothetical protein